MKQHPQQQKREPFGHSLGGGFNFFTSPLLGEYSHFDLIFFRWVGSTTNQSCLSGNLDIVCLKNMMCAPKSSFLLKIVDSSCRFLFLLFSLWVLGFLGQILALPSIKIEVAWCTHFHFDDPGPQR